MNRLPTVLCLSVSAIAAMLSIFALVESGPGGDRMDVATNEELRALERAVDSLREKLEEIEAKQDLPNREITTSGSSDRPAHRTRGVSRLEPADLVEQVAALSQRLASLEDDETIARLAQSGEEQAVQKELASAIHRIGDPDAAPEDRLAALGGFRRIRKTHPALFASAMKESGLAEQDLVLPLLELAQDTTIEPGLRAEAVRSLESKAPELRQPLLDLLAFEEAPEVREGTVNALMYHLGDAAVREAIARASREDRDESVRATALKYLPKVEHLERMASEETKGAASSDGR